MSGDSIAVHDREGFPAKIAALRDAAGAIRAAAAQLPRITEEATREAASFTRDGKPAPVYAPLLRELQRWQEQLQAAADSVATSITNAAGTAEYKVTGFNAADAAGEAAINTAAASHTGATGTGATGAGTTGTQTGTAGVPLTSEQLTNPGLTAAPLDK